MQIRFRTGDIVKNTNFYKSIHDCERELTLDVAFAPLNEKKNRAVAFLSEQDSEYRPNIEERQCKIAASGRSQYCIGEKLTVHSCEQG